MNCLSHVNLFKNRYELYIFAPSFSEIVSLKFILTLCSLGTFIGNTYNKLVRTLLLSFFNRNYHDHRCITSPREAGHYAPSYHTVHNYNQ